MKSYKNKILIILSFFIIFNINADDQRHIDALLDGLHQDAHEGNFDSYFDPTVQMQYF